MFSTLLAPHRRMGRRRPGPWALIPSPSSSSGSRSSSFAVIRFRRGGGPPWARDTGRSVLDERFARGDITADEYRERRDVLKEQSR